MRQYGSQANGRWIGFEHRPELVDDLAGQMHHLTDRLAIDVPLRRLATLVDAANFDAMWERSAVTSPDHFGVLRDHRAFFRSGSVGELLHQVPKHPATAN